MAEKLLNYEVIRKLGEGAASVIYAVRDPATGRKFALKHVERKKPKDIRFVQQVQAEHEISSQFTHRNLRRSYDLKISKSLLMKVTDAFLVMELVEGKPLDARPPATVLDTIVTFMHVAMGLRAMHQLGYVHCDIKPNNILRDDAGSVRVIDFGQSCRIGTTKERIQGTPDYIAPEQVNREPVTPQTDVYNLGATLYWALTGTNSPTLYTVNRKGENSFLLDATIQTPSDFNPIVTPALSKLVMDCISTRREKRPADMDAVLNRLELSRHGMQKRQVDVPDPMDSSIMNAPAPAADKSPSRTPEKAPAVVEKPPAPVAEPAPASVTEKAPDSVAEKVQAPLAEKPPAPIAERAPAPVAEKSLPIPEKSPAPVVERVPVPVPDKSPPPVAEKPPAPVAAKAATPPGEKAPIQVAEKAPPAADDLPLKPIPPEAK